MHNISIGSWAYTIGPYASNPVSFDEVTDRLAALGFAGVELGAFPPHPDPASCPTRADREALVASVRAKGLQLSGLAANLWHLHLIDTDDPKPYVDAFTENVQFCVDLGIGAIRVDTVQPPTIFDSVDAHIAEDRVVTTWKECTRIAADAGLKVVWEFEPGFAFNKPSDILRILDRVNDPSFTILYDTCHAHMVAGVGARQPGVRETLPGGALELAQKLRGRIGHVHVIDSDGTLHGDETSTHNPFGEGVLDFSALIPELHRTVGSEGWWTIDLCFWPDAWAVTERCKTSLDALLDAHLPA